MNTPPINERADRTRILWLAAIMGVACLLMIGIVISILYQIHLEEAQASLAATAQSQARIIEAIALYDEGIGQQVKQELPDFDSDKATMSTVLAMHEKFKGFRETGEFTLAKRENEQIVFQFRHRHGNKTKILKPVPFNSKLAEPMRRALSGNSGTVIGLDYRGEKVLAAHEPVAVLGLGIVAKMDMSEIRAPFVKAGITALLVALIVIMVGTYIFIRISDPIIQRLGKDLAQRVKAEEALKRYESIVSSSTDMLALIDTNFLYLAVNKAYLGAFCKSEDAVIGHRVEQVFGTEFFETIIKPNADRCLKGEEIHYQKWFDFPGTGHRYLDVAYFPFIGPDDQVSGFVVRGRDITSWKLSEDEHRKLSITIEQSPTSIMITDIDGTLEYVNPAFTSNTGYAKDEVIGRSPRFLDSGHHDIVFFEEMWQTLRSGKPWQAEICNRKKDGTLFWETMTTSPVKDENDEITHFVSVMVDQTNRKRLQKQLQQTQKMEAVGTLAGGIAHDFNNILAPILGYTEMLMERLPEERVLLERLGIIHDSGNRAKELVAQILTFARKGEEEKMPVEAQSLLKEALKFTRSTFPSSIEIRQKIDMSCHPVLAHPTQLHQVMMNLLTNARHAIGNSGGVLSISLQEVNPEVNDLGQTGSPGGKQLCLTVTDSGHGMAPKVLERIFEPYFTTKKKGEGTGLGLAVSHGIVESMGGRIAVTSAPGKGTTFRVYIPLATTTEFTSKTKKPVTAPGGNEHLLVVDDEVLLLDMVTNILEELGYKVTPKADGIEAWEAFQANPRLYDAVVTDMTMPHMSGDELAVKILEHRPDMPIIICTGFNDKLSETVAKELGIAAFILKPVARLRLALRVRQVLNAKRSTVFPN